MAVEPYRRVSPGGIASFVPCSMPNNTANGTCSQRSATRVARPWGCRRVGESDVVRARLEFLDETHGIRAVDAHGIAGAEGGCVLVDGLDARGAHLD